MAFFLEETAAMALGTHLQGSTSHFSCDAALSPGSAQSETPEHSTTRWIFKITSMTAGIVWIPPGPSTSLLYENFMTKSFSDGSRKIYPEDHGFQDIVLSTFHGVLPASLFNYFAEGFTHWSMLSATLSLTFLYLYFCYVSLRWAGPALSFSSHNILYFYWSHF